MRQVRALLEQCEQEGIKLRLEGETIRWQSARPPNPRLLEGLRTMKAQVAAMLRERELEDWEALRSIGRRLGDWVTVDGKRCRLWGVTPRGPIVHTGALVITVEPEDVQFVAE